MRYLVFIFVCLTASGCVTQKQLDDTTAELVKTREAIAALPDSPQKARSLAVVDSAGNVIERVMPVESFEDVGPAIQAAAPLTGQLAPWVTLIGGAVGAYITTKRNAEKAKKNEDAAFDEGVARGSTGEVAPK